MFFIRSSIHVSDSFCPGISFTPKGVAKSHSYLNMSETEITENGSINFGGSRVGEIAGLSFMPDAYGYGHLSEIDRGTLDKAVATAITARAGQIAEAPNDQFILSADNILRWKGFEVARLKAGESELEPELQFSINEQLNGAHREWVEARLKAYLRYHISSQLKPLFDLRSAMSLPEGARGIGFKIIEALGVLERAQVATEVKALDQAVRSEMRKLGVRFGAHHIYAPATLKPKPRALAAQLWLLKRNEMPSEAMVAILQLAQSGRTTWPADTSLPPEFYRVLGYKLMGTRAVRVDILERLADLIRPIVSYRDNVTPGAPPLGRVGREGFIVTPEMTSLLGASGEDMAVTLRALGYIADVKPRLDIEAQIKKAQEEYAAKHPTPIAIEAKTEEPKVEVEIISKEKPEAPPEVAAPEAEAAPAKEQPTTIEVWHFPKPARTYEKRPPRPRKKPEDAASNQNKPGRNKPNQDGERRPRGKKRPFDKKEKREHVAERRLVFSTETKKDKTADPDSPFAKLAALKNQLDQKTS
jgi:ATP-dependent RNA helicase SUPV3L1/SUV3